MGFVKWNKGHAPVNGYQSGNRTHDLHTAGQRKYTVVSNLMFKVKGVLNFFQRSHHKKLTGGSGTNFKHLKSFKSCVESVSFLMTHLRCRFSKMVHLRLNGYTTSRYHQLLISCMSWGHQQVYESHPHVHELLTVHKSWMTRHLPKCEAK